MIRSFVTTIVICFFASTLVYSQYPRLQIQTGHSGKVNSIAFSPDGELLARRLRQSLLLSRSTRFLSVRTASCWPAAATVRASWSGTPIRETPDLTSVIQQFEFGPLPLARTARFWPVGVTTSQSHFGTR